jgi:hypothetical protein
LRRRGLGYAPLVRKTTMLLSATIALCGLSACGDSDDGGTGGGLGGALDAVSAGPASQQTFAYTDVAALRDVTDLPRRGERVDREFMRWNVPATIGAPALTQRVLTFEGVDLFSADRFVTIGLGGDGATRIDGLEGDTAALTELMDASTAKDGTVVVAGEEAARDEVLGEGDAPLGDRAEYAAAADCLGDVLAAEIGPARQAGFPPDAAELVAVGIRGGDDPADVLCVVGDGDQVERADAALHAGLDPDAVSQATKRRISDEVADVEFATGDSDDRQWARVEVTPKADAPLGYLFRTVYQMQLPRTWFGDTSTE